MPHTLSGNGSHSHLMHNLDENTMIFGGKRQRCKQRWADCMDLYVVWREKKQVDDAGNRRGEKL